MKTTPAFSLNRNSGIGLLEVMLAVGITGIIAAGLSQIMSFNSRAQNRISQRSDITTLRNTIDSRISCSITKQHLTAAGVFNCPTGPISVYDSNGNKLIDGSNPSSGTGHTKMGTWTVRSLCSTSTSSPGLVVEAAIPLSGTNLLDANPTHFAKDPLSPYRLSWSTTGGGGHNAEVYPSNGRPCAKEFGQSSPTTCLSSNGQFCSYQDSSTAVVVANLQKGPSGCVPSLFGGYSILRLGNPVSHAGLGASNPDPPYYVASQIPYVNYYDVNSANSAWSGTAICPSGYHAVGGGVQCPNMYGVPLLSVPVQSDGTDGRPPGSPNGWLGQCCGQAWVGNTNMTSAPNGVAVICAADAAH